MDQELTKETAIKLMESKGQVKGVVFQTDKKYILKEKGEEGLKLLEQELEKLGYPIKYREINAMSFHPVGLRAISLLMIKKVFGFDNKEIEKIGTFATKVSWVVRLFVRYFFSTEKFLLEKAPKMWRTHWTEGDIIATEVNEEEKYAVIQLKNFNLCPTYCSYLKGYFSGILRLTTGSPNITIEEVKCFFRGDEYHEYLIKWI